MTRLSRGNSRPTNEEVFGPFSEDPSQTYLRVLELASTDPGSARWLAEKIGGNRDSISGYAFSYRLMHDPNPKIEALGIIAMSYSHAFGNADAGRVVTQLMTDPNEDRRILLADGLRGADAFHHHVCKELVLLSKDPSPKIRAIVAEQLFGCGLSESDEALCRLLQDKIPMVRVAAASHLPYFYERPHHVISKGVILGCVEDSSDEVRTQVCGWLAEQDIETALKPLLRLATDVTVPVRAAAIEAMERYQGIEITECLLKALKDKSDKVRAAAARSLRDVVGDGIARKLHMALSDPSPLVRRYSARALVGRVESNMIPALKLLTQDHKNAQIQMASIVALGSYAGPEIDPILCKLLIDPTPCVQRLAKKTLLSSRQPYAGGPLATADAGPVTRINSSVRMAFLGETCRKGEPFEQFMLRVEDLQGVTSGRTDKSPTILFAKKDSSMVAVLPFGPDRWIKITTKLLKRWRGRPGYPRVGYQLITAEELLSIVKAEAEQVLRGQDILQMLTGVT